MILKNWNHFTHLFKVHITICQIWSNMNTPPFTFLNPLKNLISFYFQYLLPHIFFIFLRSYTHNTPMHADFLDLITFHKREKIQAHDPFRDFESVVPVHFYSVACTLSFCFQPLSGNFYVHSCVCLCVCVCMCGCVLSK